MTTYERLEKLRDFVYERLCEGRSMRARDEEGNEGTAEPRVFIGYCPEGEGRCFPSVLIAPLEGFVRPREEDGPREGGAGRPREERRPQGLEKRMTIQFTLSVYDPGPEEEAAGVLHPQRAGVGSGSGE